MSRIAFAAVTAVVLTVTAPAQLVAQVGYFGQNKVQYRKFDFRVMKTAHFDVWMAAARCDSPGRIEASCAASAPRRA